MALDLINSSDHHKLIKTKPKPPKNKHPFWISRAKLGFPAALLLCTFFFIAGLFASVLFIQEARGGVQLAALRRLEPEELWVVPRGETGDDSVTIIPFQVLSWSPRAVYFPNFATPEQCKSIIDMARPGLKPSTLALRQGETVENTRGIRTSMGVFINTSEDDTGIVDAIEEKIARATMLPRTHYEAFNVLRYELGQKYDSHYDAFDPAEYGPVKSQRVASFLLYLTDVEEGGQTMLPFENGVYTNASYDFTKCIGFRVKPRQGDGFLFYSLFPNGTIDPTSLHGSCPVIKGIKWVATKWIRDQVQSV